MRANSPSWAGTRLYRDDLLSRGPCIMFLLVILSMMYTFSSPKSAKHPLSQNMPIERIALFFKSKKMYACRASMGRVFEEVNLYGMNR